MQYYSSDKEDTVDDVEYAETSTLVEIEERVQGEDVKTSQPIGIIKSHDWRRENMRCDHKAGKNDQN